MEAGMDWLMGLQNLLTKGVQDPEGFSLKAASAGVDPGSVDQLLQGLFADQKGWQPGQTPAPTSPGLVGRPEGGFMGMLNPQQNTEQIPQGLKQILAQQMNDPSRQVPIPTTPAPAQASSLTTGGTPTTNPAQVAQKAGVGLTQEQMLKLAAMMPQASARPAPSSPGGGAAPKTVQMGSLATPGQGQRRTLADILGR